MPKQYRKPIVTIILTIGHINSKYRKIPPDYNFEHVKFWVHCVRLRVNTLT